jgi:hypothetical protein
MLFPLEKFEEHCNDLGLDFNGVKILLLRYKGTDLDGRSIENRD